MIARRGRGNSKLADVTSNRRFGKTFGSVDGRRRRNNSLKSEERDASISMRTLRRRGIQLLNAVVI